MKHTVHQIVTALSLCSIFATGVANAQSTEETYRFKITNGSGMPLSPGVVYVKKGNGALVTVGQAPTAGFSKLCQTGSPDDRIAEVKHNSSTQLVQKSSGLQPGETIEVVVPVLKGEVQSVHFEAMYGKTKDSCATLNIDARDLTTASAGEAVSGRDEVLATGAFQDPALASDNMETCTTAAAAVDCLRQIAGPAMMSPRVRFFPGYLPSVVNFLETHYGAKDVQTLLIPTSGAVKFQIMKNGSN